MKQKTFLIIIALVLALGGGFYLFKNKAQESAINKNAVFSLKESLDSIILETTPQNLSEAGIAEYQRRIALIEAEINQKTEEARDADFWVVNYNNLAIYKSYLGEYQEAYDLYLKSLAKEDRRITWAALGSLLVKMQAYQSAEEVLNKVIEMNKLEAPSYIALASLYQAQNDNIKTKKIYEQGLKEIGENALILDEYASWLVSINDNQNAIKIYERYKIASPQNKEITESKIEKLKAKI